MVDEDDVNIVDEDDPIEEANRPADSVDSQAFYARPPRTIAESVMRSSRRRSTPPVGVGLGLSTRSSTAKPKGQPKLKLKLSEKATAAMASGTSFLGSYDRELDSDDEDLSFEEQFILRMPPGEDCEKLRKIVAARETSNDVWFKFKDSRRAVFHIGDALYTAKLVDLPSIIESQKTLDNKQMFKVADICQMLVVEDKIDSEEAVANQKGFNIDEFIWPHGITPPLHHVRKRRFRKRINRRTIETVEQEVERLLEEDAKASQVQYVVLENVNPDLSDSEFLEREEPQESGMPGSDAIDAPTPGAGVDEEYGMEEDDEGEIDEELAAELDLALGDEGEGEEDGEDGDDEDEDMSEEEEEDEDEDDETVQARRLLNEEIRDLEAAVAKKNSEIASSANPIIKRRFEDALRKLQADLDSKLLQRDELSEQQRMRKEGFIAPREDSEPNEDGDDGGDMDVE